MCTANHRNQWRRRDPRGEEGSRRRMREGGDGGLPFSGCRERRHKSCCVCARHDLCLWARNCPPDRPEHTNRPGTVLSGTSKPIWYWIHARGVKKWSASVWDAIPVAAGPCWRPQEDRRPSCRSSTANAWPEWTIVADCCRVRVSAGSRTLWRERTNCHFLLADWRRK